MVARVETIKRRSSKVRKGLAREPEIKFYLARQKRKRRNEKEKCK